MSAALNRGGALVTVGLVVALLFGCAPATREINPDTANAFQQSVSAIVASAAADDIDAALAQLQALESELIRQSAAGNVSAARSAQILAAIQLVRTDLLAAAPPEPPTSTPTPEPDPGTDPGNKGRGKGNDK